MTRSTRLWLTVVVLVAAIVVFTFLVLGHDKLAFLDLDWRDWVIAHRSGFASDVMVAASWFGSAPSLAVVIVGTSVWLVRRGRRGDAVFFALAAVGGMLVGPVLKDLFDRARPALAEHVVVVHSSSYPSGHSLNSMVVLGLLTVLAARAGRKALVVAVGAALVGLVGFSRVYLGVHYPSDVLAGWLIGATWITLCHAIAPLVRGNSRRSGTVQGSS